MTTLLSLPDFILEDIFLHLACCDRYTFLNLNRKLKEFLTPLFYKDALLSVKPKGFDVLEFNWSPTSLPNFDNDEIDFYLKVKDLIIKYNKYIKSAKKVFTFNVETEFILFNKLTYYSEFIYGEDQYLELVNCDNSKFFNKLQGYELTVDLDLNVDISLLLNKMLHLKTLNLDFVNTEADSTFLTSLVFPNLIQFTFFVFETPFEFFTTINTNLPSLKYLSASQDCITTNEFNTQFDRLTPITEVTSLKLEVFAEESNSTLTSLTDPAFWPNLTNLSVLTAIGTTTKKEVVIKPNWLNLQQLTYQHPTLYEMETISNMSNITNLNLKVINLNNRIFLNQLFHNLDNLKHLKLDGYFKSKYFDIKPKPQLITLNLQTITQLDNTLLTFLTNFKKCTSLILNFDLNTNFNLNLDFNNLKLDSLIYANIFDAPQPFINWVSKSAPLLYKMENCNLDLSKFGKVKYIN